MVIRSAISKTSSIRCEMKRIATPLWRSDSTIRKRRRVSLADRDAVGSSMIRTRAFTEIALAISTVCCSATVSPRAACSTSISTPSRARTASASRRAAPRSTIRPRSRCAMKMFSATVRSGKTSGSW
jgi:hypothetical protein